MADGRITYRRYFVGDRRLSETSSYDRPQAGRCGSLTGVFGAFVFFFFDDVTFADAAGRLENFGRGQDSFDNELGKSTCRQHDHDACRIVTQYSVRACPVVP